MVKAKTLEYRINPEVLSDKLFHKNNPKLAEAGFNWMNAMGSRVGWNVCLFHDAGIGYDIDSQGYVNIICLPMFHEDAKKYLEVYIGTKLSLEEE